MADGPTALQALRADAALVNVEPWEVIGARGNDRVGFLHRVLTGRIEGIAAGQGGRTMLLTPKGHIVADLLFFMFPEEVRLVAPPGQGEATVQALGRYAIMDDFTARLEPDRRLVAIYGPRAAERLSAAGVKVPETWSSGQRFSHATVLGPAGELWLVRVRDYGAEGVWAFGSPEAVEALGARLAAGGIERLDDGSAEALRIVAGEPRFGREIGPDYFPMEVGRSAAIDYSKGCYLGQEPIVRIRDRGHVNWRLVGLRFGEDGPVAGGDRLETDAKPKAGRLTSVARLPDGQLVALALLHLSVAAGAEVRVRHGETTTTPATVVALAEDA